MGDWADDLLQGGGPDDYGPDWEHPSNLGVTAPPGVRNTPAFSVTPPPAAPDWADSLLQQPDVGVTLEGLDTEAAAAEARQFQPWTQPGDAGSPTQTSGSNTAGAAQWSGDELDTLGDFGQRAAMSATFGYGDEILGALGADKDAIRNRVALAKERSPTAALAGDVTGGVAMGLATGGLASGAARALPLAGRVAAGAGLGAEQAALSASGYADDGDRLGAATDAAPIGAALGAGGELAATGLQNAGQWAKNTVAPWLQQQGYLNRVASSGLYGGSMDRLATNQGGKEGVAELGRWMENQGLTHWTPEGIGDEAASMNSMWQGDQRYFLDDLAQRPGGPPMVDTGRVAGELGREGNRNLALAPVESKALGNRYVQQANNLTDAAPSGQMPFEDALRNRQAFDNGVNWQQLGGSSEDAMNAEVARMGGNGLRGELVESLENTSPELAPRWEAIQENLHNSSTIAGAGQSRANRELGNQPISLPSLMASAGGGFPGLVAAAAVKTGGRAGMANTLGGAARATEFVGDMVDGTLASAGGKAAANYAGEQQGAQESARGYLLPQAIMQALSEGGAELGQYAQQFAEATKQDGAIPALLARLRETDTYFRTQVLPKLQARTAETGY